MKKLIVNAIDFGFNANVNKGIIKALKDGIVTTASIIVTKEGFREAIDLARDNPRLEIGIHLDLDRFFNIDHQRGIAVDLVCAPIPPEEIRQEIIRQVDRLNNTGIKPVHVSSHHNTHLHQDIFPIVCEITEKYNIKIMQLSDKLCSNQSEFNGFKMTLKQHNLLFVPHFIHGWYFGNIDEEYEIAELVTHPGYGEIWRECELAHCCSPEIKKYLLENNIKLINSSDFISSCA